MPYTDAALNVMADALAGVAVYVSAHTADPGATGLNEVSGGSYARQSTTWGSASSGDRVGSQVAVPIPAATTVTWWGLWSAPTGGTFYGGFVLAAAEAFGAAGNLVHTPTLDVDPA